MVYGREFTLLVDLTDFINKNKIQKEDIITAGAQIDRINNATVTGIYFIIFCSDKDNFEDVYSRRVL